MWKFVLCSFAFLAWGFFELSGGSDFTPPEHEKARVARTLATYDIPEGSTQAVPVIVEASTPAPVPDDVETPEADPVIAEPIVDPNAPKSLRPKARDLAALASVAPQAVVTIAPVEPAGADIRLVNGNRVNMREGPSTDFSVITQLGRNTQVEVLETNDDGWARLKVIETGQTGWMAERLLTR